MHPLPKQICVKPQIMQKFNQNQLQNKQTLHYLATLPPMKYTKYVLLYLH